MDFKNRMILFDQILHYNQIYLANQPDFLPAVDSEQSVVVEQNSEQRVTERHCPQRLNRRPPVRYSG